MKELPKIIWIYWDQGWGHAPKLVQQCKQSWEYYHPDWEIRALDAGSIKQYFDFKQWVPDVNIPAYLPKFLAFLKRKRIKYAAKSDIIRANLLNHYGGVWVDATLWCNRSMDLWLGQHMSSGFFALSHPTPCRKIASWFLASNPGSLMISELCLQTQSYWSRHNRADHYFWFHRLFNELYATNEEFKSCWDMVKKIECPTSNSGYGAHYFRPFNDRPFQKVDAGFISFIKNDAPPVFKLRYKQRGIADAERIKYLFETIHEDQER